MQFQGSATFMKALPLMASAMIALLVGGLAGLGLLAVITGSTPGPLAVLSPIYGSHWFLMILGFTNALISAELLTLLSMEWSRRIAPRSLVAGFLVAYWISIALYITGSTTIALIISTIGLALVAWHTSRVLLTRSWIGLPPTHYNYLLTATPIIMAMIIVYWLAAQRLGLPSYNLPLASLILPVTAIIAVESRDIPLLLGIPPTKSLAARSRSLRIRAVAAYITSSLGILALASDYTSIGGMLIAVGGVLALTSVALLEAVERASKAVPATVKRHVATHVTLSYAWFIGAGLLALASSLGVIKGIALGDAVTHMLTLGFMFNVIMGIDAILLYGHAGISLDKTPPPQPWPGLLLNTGLALRILHDIGLLPGWIAVAGGALTGVAIIIFYVRNMINIRRILSQGVAKEPWNTP